MDRLLRTVLDRLVRAGNLRVTTAAGSTLTFGDGTGEEIAVRLVSRAAERAIVLDPELRVGEAYMDGSLVVERGSIADVLALALRQRRDGKPPSWARPHWLPRYLPPRPAHVNPGP